jgi:hypothetical protein
LEILDAIVIAGLLLDLVHSNDPGDSDAGPNNLQNFPVITFAKTGRRATTIKGTLNSTADTTFTL